MRVVAGEHGRMVAGDDGTRSGDETSPLGPVAAAGSGTVVDQGDAGRSGPTIDMNEVVAHNFRAARQLRGWTQDQTAAQLEAVLGRRFSQAAISSIEAAGNGGRRREFDAQELLVFAVVFDVPIVWFLLPPPGDTRQFRDTSTRVNDLCVVIFGRPDQREPIYRRLRQLGVGHPGEPDAGTDNRATLPSSSGLEEGFRERLTAILLALAWHHADPLDKALEQLGAFIGPLRRVGLRQFVTAHLEAAGSCPEAINTNPARCAPQRATTNRGGTP